MDSTFVIAYQVAAQAATAQHPEEADAVQLASSRSIDCDVHLAVPSTRELLPYLDDYWREHVIRRGIDGDNPEPSAYPPNAPLNRRPDWRPSKGLPGSQFEQLRDHVLEPFKPRFVICNALHGSQIMFSEDLSAAPSLHKNPHHQVPSAQVVSSSPGALRETGLPPGARHPRRVSSL